MVAQWWGYGGDMVGIWWRIPDSNREPADYDKYNQFIFNSLQHTNHGV